MKKEFIEAETQIIVMAPDTFISKSSNYDDEWSHHYH